MRGHPSATPALFAFFAALFALGCSAEPENSPPPKILLIGLDGADLRLVEKLSAAGRLPNLTHVMDDGVRAPLLTVANSSPIVWTSIATGTLPEHHGIDAFVKDGKPVDATLRQRPAFWNILSAYGTTVGVLAWWASFPAESVYGYIVSPYLVFQAPDAPEGPVIPIWEQRDPRKTFPPELHKAVGELMRDDEDLDPEDLRDVYVDEATTPQTAWVLARDQSYLALTKALLKAKPVELVATYLQGIDVASHDTSRHVFGGTWYFKKQPKVNPEEQAQAMERVYAMYELTDAMVGELLEAIGPDTDVIIVSDHGWEYDGTGHLHKNPGLFLASGPSFPKDTLAAPISVLDILPLILGILEIPIAKDLDGSFPTQVIAQDFRTQPSFVDTYTMEAVSLPRGIDAQAPEDSMMLERLRGLGYIE